MDGIFGREGMKRAAVCAAAAVLAMGVWAQDYELVWSDEFDGPAIDSTKWEHEVNDWGGGNNELQYYTDRPENSRIEDGMLVIEAREEGYLTRNYTSARLRTKGKADFLYGKVEARIKVPRGQGMWPAFWMLPTNSPYGGWAASGEIDIMETINDAGFVAGSLHYGGEWPNNTHTTESLELEGVNFADDFHVYTVEWLPTEFRWYVDGQLYSTRTDWWSSADDYPAPFDQEFHILLNVAVGGNWPGSPDGSTEFPQQMRVDWVRVYQLDNLPPTVSITAPGHGSTVSAGVVEVTVDADDHDGILSGVRFYVDGMLVGTDTLSPYVYEVELEAGCHTIRVVAEDNGGATSEDTVVVRAGAGCDRYPYHGAPHAIPGLIEAEDFDIGASGVAYSDTSPGNEGGAYRDDADVDVQASSEHAYNVGWFEPGEWLSYTVNVTQAGAYLVEARVASPENGGTLHMSVGGTELTSFAVPVTGGWQTWQTVSATVELDAGEQELVLRNDASPTSALNLNYVRFTLVEASGGGEGEPDIVFTSVPALGSFDNLAGEVSGADESEYRVVVYIFVPDGGGWWIKPGFDQVISFASDGSWSADVTTGGTDESATKLAAFLIPVGYTPPNLAGVPEFPAGLLDAAVAHEGVRRAAGGTTRLVYFSGYEWWVKDHASPVGPGPNVFSASHENVRVDADGRLHLKITGSGSSWQCSEIVSTANFGYGTYLYRLASPVDQLDPNTVVGLFTWSDQPEYAHREIDIEFSRWSDPGNDEGQFVLQPWDAPGHIQRFTLGAGHVPSAHGFTWRDGSISWRSVRGVTFFEPEPNAIIYEWNYAAGDVPVPGDENARLNFWLMGGSPPTDGQEAEVIFDAFDHVALGSESDDAPVGVISSNPPEDNIRDGDTVTLTASPVAGSYQWYKDGEALVDSERITGAQERVLTIQSVSFGDAGSYTCAYDTAGAKHWAQTAPFMLQVLPAQHVPVNSRLSARAGTLLLAAIGCLAAARQAAATTQGRV